MCIFIEFVMKNAQMAEKTNMTRLIHIMLMKLNDPKPVIRVEVESFFHQLSYVSMCPSLMAFRKEYEDSLVDPDSSLTFPHIPYH